MESANAAGLCLGKRDPSFGGYIYIHSLNGRHSLIKLRMLGSKEDVKGQCPLTGLHTLVD